MMRRARCCGEDSFTLGFEPTPLTCLRWPWIRARSSDGCPAPAVPWVGFALNEPVVIRAGPMAGRLGTVVSLIALQPEPVYTIELEKGRAGLHLPESALAGA